MDPSTTSTTGQRPVASLGPRSSPESSAASVDAPSEESGASTVGEVKSSSDAESSGRASRVVGSPESTPPKSAPPHAHPPRPATSASGNSARQRARDVSRRVVEAPAWGLRSGTSARLDAHRTGRQPQTRMDESVCVTPARTRSPSPPVPRRRSPRGSPRPRRSSRRARARNFPRRRRPRRLGSSRCPRR
jgi:hypothetical protein